MLLWLQHTIRRDLPADKPRQGYYKLKKEISHDLVTQRHHQTEDVTRWIIPTLGNHVHIN